MLESLEQSNIKRMSIEGPEKKASGWFDHESEITETDKLGMQAKLESSRSSNNWYNFAELAANMKALSDSEVKPQTFNNPALPEQRSF